MNYTCRSFWNTCLVGLYFTNLLESVLHFCYPLPNRLYEVVMTRYLAGDYGELVPLIALQDAQHGGCLVFQRRGKLQLKTRLGCSLQRKLELCHRH